jgi:putative sporulation protein YyaC
MNFLPNFFDRKIGTTKIFHTEASASEKLAIELHSKIQVLDSNRPIVFVCIGTDRSTGDSLGPLVGTLLEEKPIMPFFVYGTLDDPIHAVNLSDKIITIKEKHANPFIIGIDACLGRLKNVGVIQIADGPVKPGAGVNKDLPEVGNIHITGIVNVSGFMEFFVLQNTRLNLVLKMAKTIANGIHEATNVYQQQQQNHWTNLPWEQMSKEKLT